VIKQVCLFVGWLAGSFVRYAGCNFYKTKVYKSIGVGAQSTLGGHQIFARKICIKNQQNARILHDFCPKNYQNTRIFMIFARNFYKIPELYMIFARKVP